MTKRTGLCGRMRSAGLLLAAALLALVVSGTWTQPRVAEAQSAGVVEVPADWALIPAGVEPGEGFRLLFRSNQSRSVEFTDIAVYDAFVQNRVAAGHQAIREHSARFQVVGSTAAVDARDHIRMNPTNPAHLDVPVYWLNGAQVAAGAAGFWSDDWASAAVTACRDQDGQYRSTCNFLSPNGYLWTGTNTDGTKHANPLGASPNVRAGSFRNGKAFSYADRGRGSVGDMLGISPVFQVALPPPELSASYTQVYEGERKVIVFETTALSVGFAVSAVGGLTANDYRIYSPPDAAVPLLGTSWTAMASNGLVKFALEGVSDTSADPGEALRVTLSSGGKAFGRADIKVRDGERPLSLLFRVRRGSPTEEWVETDRPALTLHEGGADVSYQIRVSRDAPGYTTANMHISPNPNELYRIDAIRPGPWDDDRFIYRDPGPHRHGNSTSLIIGTGGWSTVTFGAGQDEDAHNHAITLYHRVSPRAMGWSGLWPVLAGPDSRQYSAPQAGLTGARRFERVSPCFRPGVTSCWTWPLSVQIVDDDKWEQELVYARHDPGANDGNGGPDGNWVLASDGGLRKALPAALAPGSEYTFYIRLAVDPATLPKDGTVSRDQPQSYYQNGQWRTRRVDVYPPTFLPARIPVWVTVKGASNDRHGVPDMRLLITPHSRAAVQPNTGTYFITDTSGTRNHPSVEADYNYRDNTLPGEKGDLLFWDEPMAVTIVVREDAPLGVSRGLSVRSDSGMLTRPGCGRGWSKYNCTGDYSGYYFWDGLDIAIGLVEDLKPRGQFSARDFAPRTPEEVFEFVKLANFGNEEAPFVPFADVTEERGGIGDGARASITEGETARFTVTLTPAPSEPRAVTVNVLRREGSTELGVAGRLGVRTVMVGPSGSARLEIPTADNDEVGDNGYLQVAVVSSPTYRVSAFGGVAELDVLSDDAELVSDAVRVQRVTDSAATIVWDPQPGAASYEVVWLEGTGTATRTAFTSGTSIELTGLEPGRSYDVAVLDDLWNRVGSVEFLTLEPGGGERFYPVLSVTAGAGVTEGGTASFTVTASPAPGAPLTVPLWVSQRGAYAAAGERGVRRVTIPASGSVSFEVATVDDASDEPDGAIVATLERAKLGYHLGASARAEVGVADNDDGSASPEVSVTAGGAVEEGASAVFTVTASPAPAQPVTVTVTVSQVGDFGVTTGAQTVTIPTSGSATLSVATSDDETDERRGSVSVDVDAGDGYSVSVTQGRATVLVADNDEPQPQIFINALGAEVTEGGDARFMIVVVPKQSEALKVSVTVSQQGDFGAATGSQTVTIPTSGLATLTVSTTDDSADEPNGSVSASVDAGEGYTVSAGNGSASVSVLDNDEAAGPEVSVTAGSGVTEGGTASFTVSASPAPDADLTVSVTVSQDGEYGATTGSRTVTVPTSGSATLTVSTTDDDADEPDGSVSVAVAAGEGYSVSGAGGTAKVSVADNDDPPAPEVNISGTAGGEEGGNVTFTLTATPAPSAPLAVKVTVTAGGDFGVTTGSRTVTIPTSGSATLTLSTTDDDADEPNGSVTLTLNDGDGYSVGALSSDTASVLDNDDAPLVVEPEVSVTAGAGVTEGGTASFTVSASPAPSEDLTVSVTVSQDGDYGATTGSRTVTIPASGSATLTVSTTDDSADETDGSVSVAVDAGDGYTVSATQGSASVNVADNDDPPAPEVSVTAGAGVTEGQGAVFTVSASPAPSAPLAVTVTVTQDGDYGASTGSRTVTIPASGSATLTVSTTDDSADETDGSVSVAVDAGDGYTVSATQGSASVNVADNDDPPAPEVSVTAGAGVTEGQGAVFTVSASPAPSAPLAVTVTVTQDGDYGASTGSRTVTIPTSGSATLTVSTTDDGADEPNGSVSVAVNAGDGYTVSATQGSAKVGVADNDDTPPQDAPEVSVADGSIVEGVFGFLSVLEFRVTLSRASDEDVTVRYVIRPGTAIGGVDYWGGAGEVTIWAGFTSATIGANVKDDAIREGDETLSVELTGADGAVIAAANTATGTIVDDDGDP